MLVRYKSVVGDPKEARLGWEGAGYYTVHLSKKVLEVSYCAQILPLAKRLAKEKGAKGLMFFRSLDDAADFLRTLGYTQEGRVSYAGR